MIRLDTHVVGWLFAGATDQMPASVLRLIETEEPVVSPIVQLELTYLHEIGRVPLGGADVVNDLRARIGLRLSEETLESVAQTAAGLSWTRDPFDRLIVADAMTANVPLVTKDRKILEHCSLARWDDPEPPRPRKRRR